MDARPNVVVDETVDNSSKFSEKEMIQNDARSCDFRSQHIGSRIDALWQREPQLLKDAAIELSRGLAVFVTELGGAVNLQYAIDDEVALLRAFLEAHNYPDWEPNPGSVLNGLTEQELYLAHAKLHLNLCNMTARHVTAEDHLNNGNVALAASESILAVAERLSSRCTGTDVPWNAEPAGEEWLLELNKIHELEILEDESAADDITERTELRSDPVRDLYRLVDECARVITDMANEAACFHDDDMREYVQDGFERMVSARLAERDRPTLEQRHWDLIGLGLLSPAAET